MDIGLYGVALISFATLYLGLSVFLLWTLVIAVLVVFSYLAVRYKDVRENYPHSVGDSLTTLLFISITWLMFVLLGPKPVPSWGQGLIYGENPVWQWVGAILLVAVFVLMMIMGVLIPYLEGKVSGGGGGGDSGKAPQGVGA
jgi:phosphatidylglycerophosphate synthase